MDRYGIGLTEFGDWDEHKDPDGEWVKYSDVKELEEKNEKLELSNKRLINIVKSDLIFLIDEYGNCPDDKLSPKAIEFKNTLNELLKERFLESENEKLRDSYESREKIIDEVRAENEKLKADKKFLHEQLQQAIKERDRPAF